jgi:hypothetical protein
LAAPQVAYNDVHELPDALRHHLLEGWRVAFTTQMRADQAILREQQPPMRRQVCMWRGCGPACPASRRCLPPCLCVWLPARLLPTGRRCLACGLAPCSRCPLPAGRSPPGDATSHADAHRMLLPAHADATSHADGRWLWRPPGPQVLRQRYASVITHEHSMLHGCSPRFVDALLSACTQHIFAPLVGDAQPSSGGG